MAAEPTITPTKSHDDTDSNLLTGLRFSHFFSSADTEPFDQIEWETRVASITNEKGETVFKQDDLELPKRFSQLATNIVVSKYFKGKLGTPERERSLKEVVGRVANTITEWGANDGYFETDGDTETFRRELTSLLVNQVMAFNSPVWFNVGVEDHPQCSACFINSVEDRMESILELAKTEGMLFKYGSGAGVNLSPLRGSNEGMSHGGQASGPVSFMRGYDAFAGVIKSGGKTRRAAKMVILNIDHPDVVEFIESKTREERKARALIEAGYDSSFNGEAYASVYFQNANHSVRVTDEFMEAVKAGSDFTTRSVLSPHDSVETYSAPDLLRKIAENAWQTGDPGIQYDTVINDWHTCPNTDRIHASNPCSEYMFLNNSACNLASLNLMKFRKPDGTLDTEAFRSAVRTTITAMEIIVGNASYPTKLIEKNSHDYRPLGLGYSNLGALLMSKGMPYDSDEGRNYAAAVTALMHGEAYRTSAEIAGIKGPFKGFTRNRRPMMKVMRKHMDAIDTIDRNYVESELMDEIETVYDDMIHLGEQNGYRNAQATVLAPTGTISFLMDCDTTGIEPDIMLKKTKKLVGGGALEMVNQTVPMALRQLDYNDEEVDDIVKYVKEHGHVIGAPALKEEHLPVFDCALDLGGRSIHHMGHVRMMAAVQPFISGAISKTVNMPHSATIEEIEQVYLEGHRLGLKAIAVYRNGCKSDEPIGIQKSGENQEPIEKLIYKSFRRKLPDERHSITHKFSVGGYEGYLTVGLYEDGQPGEIFIVMAKEGSFISGLMDSFATSISIALQYGVPLKVLVRKFVHTRFEPSGFTGNKQIPFANSVMDYVFRWLALKFLPDDAAELGVVNPNDPDLFDPVDGGDNGGSSSGNGSSGGAGGNGGNGTNGSNGHDTKAKLISFPKLGNGNGNGNGNGQHEDEESGFKMTRDLSGIRVHVKQRIEEDYGPLEPHLTGDEEGKLVPEPIFDDAPMCPNCGTQMQRSGACHACSTCGATTGCG